MQRGEGGPLVCAVNVITRRRRCSGKPLQTSRFITKIIEMNNPSNFPFKINDGDKTRGEVSHSSPKEIVAVRYGCTGGRQVKQTWLTNVVNTRYLLAKPGMQ
jgi:hypothetical protein